jgi:hypothetical protein
MNETDLAAANEQLANPPEFNLTSTARLGLYVVGRLAERHGIKVRLRESPYGGTTAIVLLPTSLVVDAQHVSVPRPRPGTGPMAITPGPVDSTAVEEDAPPAPSTPPALSTPLPEEAPPPAPFRPEPGRHSTAETLRLVEPTPAEPDPAPPLPMRQRATADDPPPAPDRTQDGVTYTAAGLPWRVRQASLATPLRSTSPARPEPPAAEPEEPATSRGPEEIRRMMASYQSGTQRGRSEAYQLAAAGRLDEEVVSAEIRDEPTGDITPEAAETDAPPERG